MDCHSNFIIDYLIGLGLDVDDTLEDGRTPLLSACSEGNVHKVRALLEAGASIYSKMNDGTDVWFWAIHHYTIPYPTIKDYPLLELLQRYEIKQKKFWKNVFEEMTDDLLNGVLLSEVIKVL